jgi:hypothetical protein
MHIALRKRSLDKMVGAWREAMRTGAAISAREG